MKNKSFLLLVAAIVCLCSVAAGAQDFSADMLGPQNEHNQIKGKIYVSGDKMRFDSTRENGHGATMIWDTKANTRVVLMPERHMYMDMKDMIPGQAMSFWHPANVEDACPDWQRMAQQMKEMDKITSCHKVGPDVVNGRPAVKYEGSSSDGKSSQVWLDAKLHSMVKVVTSDGGGMELNNIQEGAQSASLFEIPSDYQKFDMGAMMKGRQKQ